MRYVALSVICLCSTLSNGMMEEKLTARLLGPSGEVNFGIFESEPYRYSLLSTRLRSRIMRLTPCNNTSFTQDEYPLDENYFHASTVYTFEDFNFVEGYDTRYLCGIPHEDKPDFKASYMCNVPYVEFTINEKNEFGRIMQTEYPYTFSFTSKEGTTRRPWQIDDKTYAVALLEYFPELYKKILKMDNVKLISKGASNQREICRFLYNQKERVPLVSCLPCLKPYCEKIFDTLVDNPMQSSINIIFYIINPTYKTDEEHLNLIYAAAALTSEKVLTKLAHQGSSVVTWFDDFLPGFMRRTRPLQKTLPDNQTAEISLLGDVYVRPNTGPAKTVMASYQWELYYDIRKWMAERLDNGSPVSIDELVNRANNYLHISIDENIIIRGIKRDDIYRIDMHDLNTGIIDDTSVSLEKGWIPISGKKQDGRLYVVASKEVLCKKNNEPYQEIKDPLLFVFDLKPNSQQPVITSWLLPNKTENKIYAPLQRISPSRLMWWKKPYLILKTSPPKPHWLNYFLDYHIDIFNTSSGHQIVPTWSFVSLRQWLAILYAKFKKRCKIS
jgi:hypothetical protein